jgi:hypothetical protein
MTAKALKDAMQRVESWPERAQEELTAISTCAASETLQNEHRHRNSVVMLFPN